MSIEWLAIRGSGLMAYLLLAAAAIWGLLVSTKVLGPMRAKQVTWFHESLSLGALLATGIHMYALTQDDFMTFTARELFVPGLSAWRPTAVALGVVAFYALALITVSFYLKKVIGQRTWRTLHYGAFGTFLAAMLHGILAGTDRAHPAVFLMYVATGSIVVLLIAVRGVQSATPARPSRARPERGASIQEAEPSPVGADRQRTTPQQSTAEAPALAGDGVGIEQQSTRPARKGPPPPPRPRTSVQ